MQCQLSSQDDGQCWRHVGSCEVGSLPRRSARPAQSRPRDLPDVGDESTSPSPNSGHRDFITVEAPSGLTPKPKPAPVKSETLHEIGGQLLWERIGRAGTLRFTKPSRARSEMCAGHFSSAHLEAERSLRQPRAPLCDFSGRKSRTAPVPLAVFAVRAP